MATHSLLIFEFEGQTWSGAFGCIPLWPASHVSDTSGLDCWQFNRLHDQPRRHTCFLQEGMVLLGRVHSMLLMVVILSTAVIVLW